MHLGSQEQLNIQTVQKAHFRQRQLCAVAFFPIPGGSNLCLLPPQIQQCVYGPYYIEGPRFLHRCNFTMRDSMIASFFDIPHRYAAVLWHLYTLRVALARAIESVLCAKTWHTGPSMHNRNGLFSLTYLTNQLGHFPLPFISHPIAIGVERAMVPAR